MFRGIIIAALARIALSGAGQEMDRAHLGPDQSLDMTAKMRRARGPPNDFDSYVSAGAYEGLAAKVRTVIGVQALGQACDWPRVIYFTILKPSALIEDGKQKT